MNSKSDSSSPGSIYLSAAAMVPLSPNKTKLPLIALMMLIMSIGVQRRRRRRDRLF